MFPEGFIKRITNQKYIDSAALLRSLEESSPVSIRVNTSKWDKSPLNAEPVSWCKSGYYLESRPSFTLDPLFHSGCYYPQEASGMFLEQAIKQTAESLDNIRVLDLCGAPGGKSTHLADILGADSMLVANDVIRSRSVILAETITKWGGNNTMVTQNDPSQFGRLSGFFDIILVDAPCSGEGMFRSATAINEWSEENALHCSERQKRILSNVWPALKENGILVYSTCTFNPGENEENIKWLIENQKAECLRLDIREFKGIEEINYHGIYGNGFYPGKVRGEGFFISVIRKTGKHEEGQMKRLKKHDLKPGKEEIEVAERWTRFSKDRLLKWGDELFAVPCDMEDYTWLFQNLKVVKPGAKLFVVKNNDYLPAHDIALSHKIRKDAFHMVDLGYDEAIAFLRRDNISLNDCPRGWNIVTYKGINLGFVKNIGSRANNYFPVEWRIRMHTPDGAQGSILKWN